MEDGYDTWLYVFAIIVALLVALLIGLAIYSGIRATQVTNDRKEANCEKVSHTENEVLMSNVCK